MKPKMRKMIWIEELEKGTYDKGSGKQMIEKLEESIGFVSVEKIGKKIYWSVPLIDGGNFSTESQELATIIAQNETIIALLLRNAKKSKRKR